MNHTVNMLLFINTPINQDLLSVVLHKSAHVGKKKITWNEAHMQFNHNIKVLSAIFPQVNQNVTNLATEAWLPLSFEPSKRDCLIKKSAIHNFANIGNPTVCEPYCNKSVHNL